MMMPTVSTISTAHNGLRIKRHNEQLYRSSGFQEIDPYPESEIPEESQPNWTLMEKKVKN